MVTSSLGYVFFIFWLYQRYSIGLSFYTRTKFCYDHFLQVSSRRKRFRAFSRQPARVPRKRPFPERFFRAFPRPSIYPFVKAKPVFTLVCKWKSCFHNSLDKALYLPHYRRKLTIWHKPCGVIWNRACKSLCAEPMCLKILYEHQVRFSHEKTAVRERMIYLLYSRQFSLTRKSINIDDFVYSKFHSFLVWFGTIVSDATIACKPFSNKTFFMILKSIFKCIVYNLKKC